MMRFEDHGGHVHGPGFCFVDMNAVHVDGEAISLDLLVTASGAVLNRVNGDPLNEVTQKDPDRIMYEDHGNPAPGF